MGKNGPINIFSKGENLKFAPYWEFVEYYIQKLQGNVNLEDLLNEAMNEETVNLIVSLKLLMGKESAEYLVNDILREAIELSVSQPDIDDKEIHNLLLKREDFIIKSILKNNDEVGLSMLVVLITNFLDTFIRIKRGADVFCDFVFSNEIITEKLEDECNINRLFYFIGSLGFTYEEIEKVLSEDSMGQDNLTE